MTNLKIEWTSDSINAEEMQDNDATITQQNSTRLSYQFAKDDTKMAANGTDEQFSSKETIAEIALSEVNTSKLLNDGDDFTGNKRTTGRQPLPEYEFITQRPPSEGSTFIN